MGGAGGMNMGPELAPLTPARAFTVWHASPAVLAVVGILALAYLIAVIRVTRAHPVRPWPLWRTGSFLAGLAIATIVTQGSIGVYGDVLFWVHMIQHLSLIMVAPALLVAGRPLILLLHSTGNPVHRAVKRFLRSGPVSVVTHPITGILLYTATIIATHLTGFMGVVMAHQAARDGEQILYLFSGYILFLPLFGAEPIRWRLSGPVRIAVLALTMPVDTFTGIVLMMSTGQMYGVDAMARPDWAINAVTDLQYGGAVMWIGGDGIMAALCLLSYVSWAFGRNQRSRSGLGFLDQIRENTLEEQMSGAGHPTPRESVLPAAAAPVAAGPAAPPPRRRRDFDDDDEQLAAYNAYLERLSHIRDRPAGRRPR